MKYLLTCCDRIVDVDNKPKWCIKCGRHDIKVIDWNTTKLTSFKDKSGKEIYAIDTPNGIRYYSDEVYLNQLIFADAAVDFESLEAVCKNHKWIKSMRNRIEWDSEMGEYFFWDEADQKRGWWKTKEDAAEAFIEYCRKDLEFGDE